MENLKQIIDEKLNKSNDVDSLKKIVVELAELADKRGATEAEMKEIIRTNLEKQK